MSLCCLCRHTRDLEERLAGVADALAAVREQVAGQGNSLADFKAAEAELRRALADKAGLADVQAVLQSQSAPALLPVRNLPWYCCVVRYQSSGSTNCGKLGHIVYTQRVCGKVRSLSALGGCVLQNNTVLFW